MAHAFIQEKELFPPVVPFNEGYLTRGIHRLHYEQCGNIDGVPVLFLHGGPGAGTAPAHRRLFDPERFHCVLFDQRGCGQSLPHGETVENTTQHLVDDIEALRISLSIDEFVLFGGSWGSTLAMAYAIEYPKSVSRLILRGIFLGTDAEVNWFLNDMGRFFPEAHESFTDFLPLSERSDLLTNYYHRLIDPDRQKHQTAAERWASYETSCSTLRSGVRHVGGKTALSMARLEAHYFVNHCFLPPNYILENIERIKHLQVEIIQGRHDVICPPITARLLAKSWGSKARIRLIDEAGHSTFEAGIAHALLAALDDCR